MPYGLANRIVDIALVVGQMDIFSLDSLFYVVLIVITTGADESQTEQWHVKLSVQTQKRSRREESVQQLN